MTIACITVLCFIGDKISVIMYIASDFKFVFSKMLNFLAAGRQ